MRRACFVLVSARMRYLAWPVLVMFARSAFAQVPEDNPPDDPPPSDPVPPAPEPAPVTPAPTPPVTNTTTITKPDPVAAPIATPDPRTGFRFGSYGRVLAGTDLRGGKPEPATIVAHGPRIVEDSYLELDLSYGFVTPRGRFLRPVITLAFDGTLFHDTGDFDAQPAIRNMFLEAEVSRRVTAWVGSRMYRGDDIYLFDYWPLDDLNTVGGGVQYRDKSLELAAHAGVNRLLNDFQFQQIDVANPEQGSITVVQLNRQRLVASGNATYLILRDPELPSFKLKVHGELHALPSGTRKEIDGTLTDLPSDTGYLVGAEAGTFGMSADRRFRRHANVFVRYARGLSAFDELAPPTSFGTDRKTKRANELTFGASANWDHALGNVMFGALSRRFVDADGNTTDFDDGWEYAIDVRPLASLGGEFFAGADLSYQARFPRGLNAITQRAEDPAIFQIAPMLVYSPMGPSAYDRPQIRVVYRAARFNDAARDLFVPDDPRAAHTWTHFLGFQAEWWFNSSTYNR
ncbi:MAG: carbohydrate porin [Kofleriaceae bacterium]